MASYSHDYMPDVSGTYEATEFHIARARARERLRRRLIDGRAGKTHARQRVTMRRVAPSIDVRSQMASADVAWSLR